MAYDPNFDDVYQSIYENYSAGNKFLGQGVNLSEEQINNYAQPKTYYDIFNAATEQGFKLDPKKSTLSEAKSYLASKGTLADVESSAGYLGQARKLGYTGEENIYSARQFLDSYDATAKIAQGANIDIRGKTLQQISDMLSGDPNKSAAFNQVATETPRTAETIRQEEQAKAKAEAEMFDTNQSGGMSREKGDYLSPAESYAKRNPDKAGQVAGASTLSPQESYQMRQQEREREAVSNMDIITDPVTGNTYARDLSIPGSTYKPYTPKPASSSTSIAPRTQVTSSRPIEAPSTVEDILSTYGFGLSGNASQQFKLAPAKSFKDVYEGLYESLGLSDVKQQIEDTLDKVGKIDQELADKVADVNDNPWLSEGVRVKQIQQLEDRYALKRAPYASNLTLYQNLYNDGREEARYVATQALQQYNTEREFQLDQVEFLIEQAEKAQEAKAALAAKSKPIEVSAGATLFDPDTGKPIFTAPTAKSQSTSGSTPKLTESERLSSSISNYQSVFVPGKVTADGTPVVDGNGYITPKAWKEAIASAPGDGIPRKDFITNFAYLLYTTRDKKTGEVTVDPSYGLTPTEIKLITGVI